VVRNIYRRNTRAPDSKNKGHRQRGPKGPVYGAIDLGTNNCRLLLAEPSESGFRVVDGFSRIVRLGEELAKTGRLNDRAMARTLDALRICANKIKNLGARQVRCIATEACRRASNGQEFLDHVEAETGLSFEIVTAEIEAELTVSGCSPLLNTGHEKALLFDIGGGSTEIIWIETPRGKAPETRAVLSFPMGVVTLAETYGHGSIEPETYSKIRASIDELLLPFCKAHGISTAIQENQVQMLGTSGTVTTLGAIYLGLGRYDRSRVDGLTIPLANIRAISARLAGMDMDARNQIPCVGADRADLMLMGCAILGAVCERWPLETLRAADRGIREGLLMGMINANRTPSTGANAQVNVG